LPTFSLPTEHCTASKDLKVGVCRPWEWREGEPKYPYRMMFAGYFPRQKFGNKFVFFTHEKSKIEPFGPRPIYI